MRLNLGAAIISSALAIALALSACAPAPKKAGSPEHEAYTLMDQGSNAKAVLLMEATIEKKPDSSEARLLLASAYMGMAGVDIY